MQQYLCIGDGYGTTQEIHNIINVEKPDAVMLIYRSKILSAYI